MKRNITILFLILCILLCACSAQENNKGYNETQPNENTQETVLHVLSNEKMSLDDIYEDVYGIVSCASGIVVAGQKDSEPKIRIVKKESIFSSPTSVNIPEGISSILCIGEGTDGGFCTVYYSNNTGEYRLYHYDGYGEERYSRTVPREDEYAGAMMISDKEALLWTRRTACILHEDGKATAIEIPGGAEINTIERLTDGSLIAFYYEGPDFVFAPIDRMSGKVGEPKTCRNSFMRYDMRISGNLENPYLHTGQALQQLDREQARIKSTVGWLNLGLRPEEVCAIIIQNETEMIVLGKGIFRNETALYFISMEKSQVQRQLITVGVMREHWSNIEAFVDYFNTVNTEYKAQIQYYDEPAKLAADITAGNAPDVLEMMNVTIPLNDTNFIDMELLMNDATGVTPQDFVSNVYQAMQIDGKTLFLIDNFSVETATARVADVGARAGWTMEEFQQLMENKGKEYTAFPAWLSPVEMLHWISFNARSEYVDYATYTCNFENEGFIKQLLLCKNQPDETSPFINLSDYDEHILLRAESIHNPRMLGNIRQRYGLFDYTFIGFPNNRGANGSFFARSMRSVMLAIPATSKNPEGAWRFVCAMYDETWQIKEDGLPLMRNQLESDISKALEESGSPFSEEDQVAMMELLQNTKDFVYEDQTISSIIEEEAMVFFADAIDGAEAARRIQNRVSLYLEEKK